MDPVKDLEFHRTLLPGDVQLSILPTRKLKTVQVSVYFGGNLDEQFTSRALLPQLLNRGTQKFSTLQAMQKQREELYGAFVSGGVAKFGEWHYLTFRLECVNGRFLPGDDDVFREGLQFLRDLIFDPCLSDGLFREEEFEQEKSNLTRQIESLIDQKDYYAFERLVQSMCPMEPYRRYEHGSTEDLESLSRLALTQYWQEVLTHAPREIYLVGDVDPQRATALFSEIFSEGQHAPEILWPPPVLEEPREFQEVRESMDVNQAKLCLGYRSKSTYSEGDLAAQILMDGILGSHSQSKLFQNVREKESLAYSVHSVLEKTKGLLFILAGVASEKVPQATEIIQKQIEDLQNGEITEAELTATRESIDNQLVLLEDNFNALVDIDFRWRLNGRPFQLREYRQELREVTRDRIQQAARDLWLDTVYLLDK